jgi:hypothetical protein
MSDVRLIYAEGRQVVMAVMVIIRKFGYPGVLAVVDADFDRVVGISHEAPDLVYTDTHDVETLIIRQSSFCRFLMKIGLHTPGPFELNIIKLREFTANVQANLLAAGSVIGEIRLISARCGARFDFQQLRHERVCRVRDGK